MSENLKVNANSSVLEHKRKHNLLVDKLFDSNGNLNEETLTIDGEPIFAEWNGTLMFPEGIEVNASFCKVVRNFKELQFILNCRLTNTTETNITIVSDAQLAKFKLPDYLLAKIYGHDGVALKDRESNVSIAYSTLYISGTAGSYSAVKYCNLFYAYGNKEIRFYNEGSSITINANGTSDFECRISLAI